MRLSGRVDGEAPLFAEGVQGKENLKGGLFSKRERPGSQLVAKMVLITLSLSLHETPLKCFRDSSEKSHGPCEISGEAIAKLSINPLKVVNKM